jgi:phosphoserine phosphatase
MSRLHVFDLDGTLLRGASVEEISRSLGCLEEASELERVYARGEVTDATGWWDRMMELWAGASEDDLDRAFEAAPWMDGVREVFSDISARGERSGVISQSPLFLVRRLERWGAHATYATTVERGVPCRANQLLGPEDKIRITTSMLDDFGLAATDCVAYGDSTSDVMLFGHLPFTVAVNAAPAIRELATRAYDGTDLRGAYAMGRALLDGNQTSSRPNHDRRSQTRERELTSS